MTANRRMNASQIGKVLFLAAVVAMSAYLLYMDEKSHVAAERFANSRKNKKKTVAAAASKDPTTAAAAAKDPTTATATVTTRRKKNRAEKNKKKNRGKTTETYSGSDGEEDDSANQTNVRQDVEDTSKQNVSSVVGIKTPDDIRLNELTQKFNDIVKRKTPSRPPPSDADDDEFRRTSPPPASSSPSPASSSPSSTHHSCTKTRLAEDISVQNGQFNAFAGRTKCEEDLETQWRKEKYKDLVLIPGLEWSVPIKRSPVCTVQEGCGGRPQPVLDQTALIGTLLEDADMTDNGSIMPDFKCDARPKY